MNTPFRSGDFVVYRKVKYSAKPGPRAREVRPETHGEFYRYEVEKYWVVAEVLAESKLLIRTRRGREHVVKIDDPQLRHANWWERWMLAHRFPRPVELPAPSFSADRPPTLSGIE